MENRVGIYTDSAIFFFSSCMLLHMTFLRNAIVYDINNKIEISQELMKTS